MTIAIDLTSLSYHITGIERYAMCITQNLLEVDQTNEYVLIFRKEIYHCFRKYIDGKRVKSIILKGNIKVFFYQIILTTALYKTKADRYLFLAFPSPILFHKKGVYNTIHDMGAWDTGYTLKFLQRVYWKITILHSVSFSKGIITVSKFSKKRINIITHCPEEKISVIPCGVFEGIARSSAVGFDILKDKYRLPDRYIMSLSTMEPRKNLELLLAVYAKISNEVDYDLVLIGRKGWKTDEVLEKYNQNKRIHITGFVGDEEVGEIYRNAMCFVFPSLYEGFGMPPLEALAMGTPVIASDAASIPEVLMQQAVYFKNNDSKELCSLLKKISESYKGMPHELNDYQKKNYTFSASAKKILGLIASTDEVRKR